MKFSHISELFPLILMACLHTSTKAQTLTCPEDFFHVGSNCYYLHSEPNTRTKASEFCAGLNSSLFGIESKEEWDLLQEAFLSDSYESLHVGKKFALAFPQIRDYSTYIKLVFVNADQGDIQITVRYPNSTADIVSVAKNGAEQYSVAPEWRVNKDQGRHVENKGITVSSEHSFRILVGNFKTGGDVYLPFPKETLGEDVKNGFVIATHTPEANNGYLGNMFVVAVFEENTTVEVYNSNASQIQQEILGVGQCLTFRSRTVDFTGYSINSSHPISVTSGLEYSRLNGETGPDALMLAVPPISWLGNEHVVPPLGGRLDDTGYLIRIVSAQDDNDISYHDASAVRRVEQTIQFGEHIDYDHPLTNSSVLIRCTKTCLVVQYNKGSASGSRSDPFMMWIPPVNLYSVGDTYLPVFTDANDDKFRNFYSIVMYSPEHQANITVDGSVLQTTQVPDWNRYRYYISDQLPSTMMSITVSSPARYLVWMYGHKSNKGYGYLGTASKGAHGAGAYWTKARKQNDAWTWPPGVRYFNWHPDSNDDCPVSSCNYAVMTNTLTDIGLTLQVQHLSYPASFMCEISANQIRKLTLSSTEKITNDSFLTDASESTCVSLKHNNNNHNDDGSPAVLHLVHDYQFDDIQLQIIFNRSTPCSKNQIFYVDSPHLLSEACTSIVARKCRVSDVRVTDDRQCNYECPCPGKVTCDIMIFNQNDLKDLEICDVFAYKA